MHVNGNRRRKRAELRNDDRRGRMRLLGALVLIGVLGLSYVAIFRPNPFSPPHVVRAIFQTDEGISLVERDVRVGGVRVGSIGKAWRVGDHAEIELELDQKITVYRNATASLRPQTPFEGSAFIDLNPGTPSTGLLGNRVIPLAHTNVYVPADLVLRIFNTAPDWQSSISQLSTGFRAIGSLGFGSLLSRAPELTRDTGEIARAVRGPSGNDLLTLIPSLTQTVSVLAGQDHELQSLIVNGNRTLAALGTEQTAPESATLAKLPGALVAATHAADVAEQVTAQLGPLANALVPTVSELGRVIPPVTGLLNHTYPVLTVAAPVIGDVREALTVLASEHGELESLFKLAGRTLANAEQQLIPALLQKTPLGLPTYLQLLGALDGFNGVLSAFDTPSQSVGDLASGHTARIDLNLPVNLPLPANSVPLECTLIQSLNPTAAAALQELGLCTP